MKRWYLPIALCSVVCMTLGAETMQMDLASAPVGGVPAGWKVYATGPDDVRKNGGGVQVVEEEGRKVLRIDDRSDQCEFGITRTFDCAPGTFFRVTARYRAADPDVSLRGLEISAFFSPAVKYRAGTVYPDASGVSVMDTVVAPPGTKKMVITFYSSRSNRTAVLLESMTVETSDKAFPPVTVASLRFAGRTFYLSPQGDDKNVGSQSSPWRSIARANRMLRPGDTAVFLPGRYEGTIQPERSGAPDAPIVYRAEEPGTAVLTGPKNPGFAAKIENRAHIELEGFRFEVGPGSRWLRVDGSRFCTFKNLQMENSTVADPIGCHNSSHLRFSGIHATRCKNIGASGVLSGDMWNNFNVTHSVFENMYVGQVGHRPFGLWFDCSNIVVRDSIFDCRWGRNFEFFSPQRVLFERCVVTNAFEGSGSFDGEAKLFLNESVIRNNLVMRNGYLPVRVSGYQYQDMPNFTSMNSRYYNNTFYHNEDAGLAVYGDTWDQAKTCCRNNIFKNNIFFKNDFDRGIAIQTGTTITPDCQFRCNLITGEKTGATTIRFARREGAKLLTTAEAETEAAPYFKNNIDQDPKFVAADRDDYSLAPDSPAIDAGEALTVTRAAGTNTIYLPVEDARYFFDGFGIPGEVGDLLMIGPDKLQARIVHIAERQNTLVLDRRVTFGKGDAVNLAYSGKAPDLGAYESGMEQPTGPRFDSEKIRPQTEKDGVLLAADFEPEHQEQWFYLWKFTRQPSSFAVVDNTTAATGKQSWRVEYVPYEKLRMLTELSPAYKDSDSTLSTHLSPAWWEMEKYPMLRFSYRIPKGVPVGVTLYCASRSATPGPGSVFVAETPDFPLPQGYVQHKLVELVADDQWHTAEIDLRKLRKLMPDYRYIYKLRFWAGGQNGKPGSRYWLDDVSVRTR